MFKSFLFVFRRSFALFIDILILFMINNLIVTIPIFNNDKAYSLNNEYNDIMKEYTNAKKSFDKAYEDKIISNDEFSELEIYSSFSSLFDFSLNEELPIEKYKDINDKMYNYAFEQHKKYYYYMTKSDILNDIISIILLVSYFGLLQYFLNGQTIGKKIASLRVISNSKDKVSIFKFIIRTTILFNILFNIVNILSLFILNYEKYYSFSNIIYNAISIVELINLCMVMYRKDGRGLHDMLSKTRVIIIERNSKKENLDDNVIDAEYNEKAS